MAAHATWMSSAAAPLRRAGIALALMTVMAVGAAAPAQAAPGSDATVVETLFSPGAGASRKRNGDLPGGPPGRRWRGGCRQQ